MQNSIEEGFANLATDSDYSYLVKRVNANHFPGLAVTSCYDRIFCTAPELVIHAAKLSGRKLSTLFFAVC